MNKCLFVVKDSEGKTVSKGKVNTVDGQAKLCGFANKQEAKAVRDKMGGIENGYHISRGKDHMGKHGHVKVPMMRRQPMAGWNELL